MDPVLEKLGDAISSFLSTSSLENVETEVSFGTFVKNEFVSGVNKYAFYRLKKHLDNDKYHSVDTKTLVDISLNYPNVRRIKSVDLSKSLKEISYEHKERIQVLKYTENTRLRASKEIPVNFTEDEKRSFAVKYTRRRNRFSYNFQNGTLDMSIINNITTDYKLQMKISPDIYEVEFEFKYNPASAKTGNLMTTINLINSILYPVRMEDKIKITDMILNFFNTKKDGFTVSLIPGWNKPVNITLDKLLHIEDSISTTKLDGERRLFIITNTVSNGEFYFKGYLMTPSTNVDLELELFDERVVTFIPGGMEFMIFDVEYYNDNIYIFDMLSLFNDDYRKENFQNRWATLKDRYNEYISKMFKKIPMIHLKTYNWGRIYDSINDSLDDISFRAISEGVSREGFDGIIIQSLGDYNSENYKWKPSSLMTIDFYMSMVDISEGAIIGSSSEEVSSDGDVVLLSVQGKMGLEKFRIRNCQAIGYISSKSGYNSKDLHGLIGEFKWNRENKIFEFYRLRNDKDTPNFITVAEKVLNDILRPISEDTMRGKGVELMRRYHNLIKANMLKQIRKTSDVICDIGSGRGGDLSKWNSSKYKTVYCVEPNVDNANILFERAASNSFGAALRTNVMMYPTFPGIEDTETIKLYISKGVEGVEGVDIPTCITAFFSLTYMMTSKDKFKNFLNTIKYLKTLTPTLSFVGIVMNGDYVLKQGDTDNDAFKLKVPPEEPATKYGNEINITLKDVSEEGLTTKTMVSDQTEWLFFMDKFQESLEKIGFETDYIKRLDENMLDKSVNLPTPSKILNGLNIAFSFTYNSTHS